MKSLLPTWLFGLNFGSNARDQGQGHNSDDAPAQGGSPSPTPGPVAQDNNQDGATQSSGSNGTSPPPGSPDAVPPRSTAAGDPQSGPVPQSSSVPTCNWQHGSNNFSPNATDQGQGHINGNARAQEGPTPAAGQVNPQDNHQDGATQSSGSNGTPLGSPVAVPPSAPASGDPQCGPVPRSTTLPPTAGGGENSEDSSLPESAIFGRSGTTGYGSSLSGGTFRPMELSGDTTPSQQSTQQSATVAPSPVKAPAPLPQAAAGHNDHSDVSIVSDSHFDRGGENNEEKTADPSPPGPGRHTPRGPGLRPDGADATTPFALGSGLAVPQLQDNVRVGPAHLLSPPRPVFGGQLAPHDQAPRPVVGVVVGAAPPAPPAPPALGPGPGEWLGRVGAMVDAAIGQVALGLRNHPKKTLGVILYLCPALATTPLYWVFGWVADQITWGNVTLLTGLSVLLGWAFAPWAVWWGRVTWVQGVAPGAMSSLKEAAGAAWKYLRQPVAPERVVDQDPVDQEHVGDTQVYGLHDEVRPGPHARRGGGSPVAERNRELEVENECLVALLRDQAEQDANAHEAQLDELDRQRRELSPVVSVPRQVVTPRHPKTRHDTVFRGTPQGPSPVQEQHPNFDLLRGGLSPLSGPSPQGEALAPMTPRRTRNLFQGTPQGPSPVQDHQQYAQPQGGNHRDVSPDAQPPQVRAAIPPLQMVNINRRGAIKSTTPRTARKSQSQVCQDGLFNDEKRKNEEEKE